MFPAKLEQQNTGVLPHYPMQYVIPLVCLYVCLLDSLQDISKVIDGF